MTFLMLAAVLVAGALLFVLPPVLGIGTLVRARAGRQRQAETALVVLREQLAELDEEHAAGQLSDAEHARARSELEHRALDEGVTAEENLDTRPAKTWAWGLLLTVPLVETVFYLMLGEPDGMDPVKISRGTAAEVTADQVALLAKRVEKNPDDLTGWSMLAHAYVLIGNLEGAAETWQKIGSKAPDNANVLIDWADVLATTQKGDFSGEPERLLGKALELDPYHVKGRMLMIAAAFQRDDSETGAKQVAELVKALDRHPEDPMGWVMLARSYVFLGDVEGAQAAWKEIGAKVPDDVTVLLEWTEVLATVQKGDFSGEPDRLLDRALTLQPDNTAALALAGIAAFQRSDFVKAAGYMERLLVKIPRNDPAYAAVLENINEARRKGGMPPLEASAAAAAEPSAEDAAVAGAPTADVLSVSGTVRLTPELAATSKPDQVVFLFVRPSQGGAPLAVLRMTVGELPAEFSFSQAPLMMQDAPLPEQVLVGARVSQHGDATAQQGDFEGTAGPLAIDAQGIDLVINQVRE